MPDEHIQPQLSFSYDAKRDRWNGYNLNEHATIIEEHAKVEMAKRKLKAEKLQEELLSGKLPEGSVKVRVRTWVTMICEPKCFFPGDISSLELILPACSRISSC